MEPIVAQGYAIQASTTAASQATVDTLQFVLGILLFCLILVVATSTR